MSVVSGDAFVLGISLESLSPCLEENWGFSFSWSFALHPNTLLTQMRGYRREKEEQQKEVTLLS